MSSDSRDLESVGKEILAQLGSSAFTTKLSDITTEKNDGITLVDFKEKIYGWVDKGAEYPALYVMGLSEDTIKDQDLYRKMWYKFAIEVYIIGDDPETLEKQSNRYVRAIDEILNVKYPDTGFFQSAIYAPTFKRTDSLYKPCSIQYWIKINKDTTN